MELFKVVKYRMPISVFDLFYPSPRNTNLLMCLPRINLDLSKLNFVFSASSIWNSLIGKLLNTCFPNSAGIMVPGSSEFSDMTAPIPYIKKKLKSVLLDIQKHDTQKLGKSRSKSKEWTMENYFKP